MSTPPFDSDALLSRALATQTALTPPADLAERAFMAAMAAPTPSTFTEWLSELLVVARISFGVCTATACALLLAVKLAPAATTTTTTAMADTNEDVYVAAVLPWQVDTGGTR